MSKIITKPLMGVYKSGKWISIPDVSIVKNGISNITLRGWQDELLEMVIQTELPHLFINCPTGAGKSKAALAVITKTEKDTNKLIIISAPQKEIGKGFLSSSGMPQNILDHTWLINPQNQLCEGLYKNEDGNIARLLEFLKAKRSKDINERILICCHATLSLLFDRLSAYDRKKYLKDIKLCIDESHHSLSQEETGNGLGKVVNYFLKHTDNNLDLVMMTATPFRGDKGSLIPEKYLNDFCRYDLDYGRHFEENCSGLEFTYNAVLHQYGNSYGVVIEDLMNKYLNRGDKVLVQIPPSNKGISNGKFVDLKMIYDAIGADQVVDDNGVVNITRADRVIKVIDLVTEKNRVARLDYLRKYTDDIDVVIGISMIKEGFDWPPANAGILIGSQGSLNAQIQLMGRMFRAYNNKGKDNNQKPVDISQVFPYVDHEKLDEDEVREQINTFMKIVYAALAMELVINPIHIDIPTKVENGKTLPRKSVKNFLTETLTDTQYTELMATVMDEFRDWKATAGDGVNNSEKIAEIVSTKLTELGITENHKEVAEFFNKSLQRSAKFQLMALQGIDVSHIDIDLMEDIEDPIDSILLGMSNGLCGAKDIREFQLLMKPVDTLRRCYELKEWVEKNGRLPSQYIEDATEKKLFRFAAYMKETYAGKSLGIITIDHVKILESIDGWKWDSKDKTLLKCLEIKKVLESGKELSDKQNNFCWKMRQAKRGEGTYKLSNEHVLVLESIPNWSWENNKPDINMELCKNIKKWMDENSGKIPYQKSQDLDESKLGRVVCRFRMSKNGKGKTKLSDEHIEFLDSIIGWSWGVEKVSTLERCNELSNWIRFNGRYPNSKRTSNDYEKFLHRFINSIKEAKKGRGNYKISEECCKILEEIPNWQW